MPDDTLDVSVIIPCYQAEAYIREALDSALSQQGVRFEVIVGDNGSTDATRRILAEYSAPDLRVIFHEENLGIFGNLNALVRLARAPLIKILCADDAILPGGLEAQVRFMRGYPQAAMSRALPQGEIQKNKGSSGKWAVSRCLPEWLVPEQARLAFATFGNLPGNLTNVIVRKAALMGAGLFDPSLPYAGDFDMWYRIASRGGIAIQKEEVVFVRAHPEQNSNLLNKRNELARQQQTIYDRIVNDLSPRDRGLLRWHLTVWVVSQQVPRAFRCWRHGDKRAFDFLFERKAYAYSGWLALFVCFATAFRRVGANCSTRILFHRLQSLGGSTPTLAHQHS